MKQETLGGQKLPYSRELEYQMDNNPEFWRSNPTLDEQINELEFIISTYYDEDHAKGELMILAYTNPSLIAKTFQKQVKQELTELKAVLRYLKKQ